MTSRRVFAPLLLLLWAGLAPAAPDGAELYSGKCAACHGLDGSGGVGVPLALPAFLDSVTDDYLHNTIRFGRPGRVMPAFPSLSDAQVDAIVAHLRGWSAGGEPDLPETSVRGDAARGGDLYAQNCASCHGANGEGGTGTGVTFSRPRDLPVIAPALNNTGFLKAATDQMIKATLIHGRPGTPMVSFIDRGLSESDIDDVVAFVRSFDGQATAPAGTPAEEEPARVYDSPYSLEQTVENVKQAAIGKNFRIIREQYFDEGLVPEGQEDRRAVMVYFCNFQMLNDALKLDPRVGLFLPCRITVVERNGKVQAMSINPKTLSHLFNNQELDRVCDEMSQLYDSILEEATL